MRARFDLLARAIDERRKAFFAYRDGEGGDTDRVEITEQRFSHEPGKRLEDYLARVTRAP